MHLRFRILAWLWIGVMCGSPQVFSQPSDTLVSLITADPGDDVYNLFGHSAVRVKTPEADYLFNYGTYNFNTPGFLLKFLRGKLNYTLSVSEYGTSLQDYHEEKRGVREQIFQLDPNLRDQFIQFLYTNAQPDNRNYKYDFFFDNCSTRIRDGLYQAVDDIKVPQLKDTGLTFRNLLHQYLAHTPFLRLGIDLIIGSKADRAADVSDQMFLPDYLHDHMANATLGDQLVIGESNEILIFDEEKARRTNPSLPYPDMLFVLVALGLWVGYSKGYHQGVRRGLQLIYTLLTTAGLLICFLWFLTDHQATKLNFNLMWLHPLIGLLLVGSKSFKKKLLWVLIALTTVALLGMSIGVLPQQVPSATMMLVMIALYFLHFRLLGQE